VSAIRRGVTAVCGEGTRGIGAGARGVEVAVLGRSIAQLGGDVAERSAFVAMCGVDKAARAVAFEGLSTRFQSYDRVGQG
jgi:hypothetical protein